MHPMLPPQLPIQQFHIRMQTLITCIMPHDLDNVQLRHFLTLLGEVPQGHQHLCCRSPDFNPRLDFIIILSNINYLTSQAFWVSSYRGLIDRRTVIYAYYLKVTNQSSSLTVVLYYWSICILRLCTLTCPSRSTQHVHQQSP